MNQDIKILLIGAVGIGFFAWMLLNAPAFGQIVSSSTQGYGNVVKALQPSGPNAGGYNPTGGNLGTGSSYGMMA